MGSMAASGDFTSDWTKKRFNSSTGKTPASWVELVKFCWRLCEFPLRSPIRGLKGVSCDGAAGCSPVLCVCLASVVTSSQVSSESSTAFQGSPPLPSSPVLSVARRLMSLKMR